MILHVCGLSAKTVSVFTAHRNARIASAVLVTGIPSVCLSVTCRYCVKTTARSTVQFALSDRNVTSFVEPKNIPQGRPLPLKSWLIVIHPLVIAARFGTFCLVAPER